MLVLQLLVEDNNLLLYATELSDFKMGAAPHHHRRALVVRRAHEGMGCVKARHLNTTMQSCPQ
jgi:hypothetical protein